MIADYTRLGTESGIQISSTKPCVALTDTDWEHQLNSISDSIVFIDEGASFLSTKQFAGIIRHTDNYYVIFNRESLHELPYSVEEIYEIQTSGKFHKFKKMFPCAKNHLYPADTSKKKIKFDILVTEDSKSGFQFYMHCLDKTEIQCETTGSNSAVFKWLKEHPDRKVLVIADGAAFGAETDRIFKLQASAQDKIQICLPESFEWLILKSGILKDAELLKVLENPSFYIDSKQFFSWENFFETYLIQMTNDTPFHYQKKELNPVYLIEENAQKIIIKIEICPSFYRGSYYFFRSLLVHPYAQYFWKYRISLLLHGRLPDSPEYTFRA